MAIEGRSPRECAEQFRTHIATLLSRTIAPPVPLLLYGVERSGGTRFRVSFRQGETPTTIPLDTRYGRLFFHLTQLVEADKTGKHCYRLETRAYWYRLQATGGLQDPALLRWEYDRANDPRHPGPPRHHLHAPAAVTWGAYALDLDKIHTPSGWVTIEELIRFLIVELGVAPVSPTWPKVVAESEDVFFQRFSGKRQGRPR